MLDRTGDRRRAARSAAQARCRARKRRQARGEVEVSILVIPRGLRRLLVALGAVLEHERGVTFDRRRGKRQGAKLLNRAREKLVRLAKRLGVELRQSYMRVGKFALVKYQRYAHAKQFKRANRALRTLKTYLGRIIRDISRKIEGDAGLDAKFAWLLSLARRVARAAARAEQNSF